MMDDKQQMFKESKETKGLRDLRLVIYGTNTFEDSQHDISVSNDRRVIESRSRGDKLCTVGVS